MRPSRCPPGTEAPGRGIIAAVLPVLLALVLQTASAQVAPEGRTLLEPCLENPQCRGWIDAHIPETLAHAGLGLRYAPLATSAIAGKGNGLVAELHGGSMPLQQRGTLGQEMALPPVVPRIALGYQYGSYTYDNPYPQLAIGGFLLPPIPSGDGGHAWSAGGELSGSVPVVKKADGAPSHLLWLGAEVGAARSEVQGSVVGGLSRVRGIDEIADYLDENLVLCRSGCLDAFVQDDLALRVGMSLEPIGGLFAFGRIAAIAWRQTLTIALDGSVWRLTGWQTQLHAGGGIRFGDRYSVSGVLVAVPLSEATSSGSAWLTTVSASTSFRFGAPRYWEGEEERISR